MLRQYQTAARGATTSLSPNVPWALKSSGDALATGHVWPMSSRILAIGVTLAGGLVLSVALIMGLEFPRHVRSQLRDDQCVVHERHPKFLSWVSQCMRVSQLCCRRAVVGCGGVVVDAIPWCGRCAVDRVLLVVFVDAL